jgi:antitoxin (DNA-binding transcriptional repressor) of toxin-antitoxin stability system
MTTTIEVADAATKMPELLTLVATGTEIILTVNHIPRAKLVPVAGRATQPRVPGLHPGALATTDDFDAPLPDEFWTGTPL